MTAKHTVRLDKGGLKINVFRTSYVRGMFRLMSRNLKTIPAFLRLMSPRTTIRFVAIGVVVLLVTGLAYSGFAVRSARNWSQIVVSRQEAVKQTVQAPSVHEATDGIDEAKRVSEAPRGGGQQRSPKPSVVIRKEGKALPPGSSLTFALPIEGKVMAGLGWTYWRHLDEWRFHPGVDMQGEVGQEVRAACDGVVEEIRVLDGVGRAVTIVHDDTTKTVYAPLQNIRVRQGSTVKRGDVIGHLDSPGISEAEIGTHLHFELRRNGKALDPLTPARTGTPR